MGCKGHRGLSTPLFPKTTMAPKQKPSVKTEHPEKKEEQWGSGKEDSFHSTAEALRAAPTEKRIICVDPNCPLINNPGIQVSCIPRWARGCYPLRTDAPFPRHSSPRIAPEQGHVPKDHNGQGCAHQAQIGQPCPSGSTTPEEGLQLPWFPLKPALRGESYPQIHTPGHSSIFPEPL